MAIDSIHNETGYRAIRSALAAQYSIANMDLDLQVSHVDLHGDRTMTITHSMHNEIPLEEKEAKMVLRHLHLLWGYDITLKSVDPLTDKVEQEIKG